MLIDPYLVSCHTSWSSCTHTGQAAGTGPAEGDKGKDACSLEETISLVLAENENMMTEQHGNPATFASFNRFSQLNAPLTTC